MRSSSEALGMALGREIAERRKAIGWTQAEFAEKLGVDTVTVSRFERGSNLPSLSRLEHVANCLKVSIASLLSASSGNADDQALMIKSWIEGISDSDRRFLMEMVREWCNHLSQKNRRQ